MKRKLFILASMLFTLTVGAQTVNVHLKNGTVVTYQASEFDYIDFTASQSPVAYTTCPDNNHPHLIDLGLPSGTLWACCNVGAHAPEEYGGYFAWGETTEKSWYDWSTYKWSDASQNLTKYNTNGRYGIVDGKTTLEPSDDAATANWGAPWHMPSLTQIKELHVKCTSTWTSVNGVIGQKFVGPNGGTVFLPAAGYRWGSELYYAGSYGYYWSSTLYESSLYNAYNLFFHSGGAYWRSDYRYDGQSVRPVR